MYLVEPRLLHLLLRLPYQLELGYHIKVRDAAHFVRLFADAQFYSCKFTMKYRCAVTEY